MSHHNQAKKFRPSTKLSRTIKPMALAFAAVASMGAKADNPLISHVYTADPAARVFDDRVYVVTSHDKDNATSYDLSDYYLFSSDDMVNWQDHGIIFDAARDTSWATQAYAPDMIKRNGKYYLIFPNSGNSIGILEANQPEGPYTDLIGGPLLTRSMPNANVQWLFDPGAFLDDDNTLYITFGGGGPGESRIAQISDDLKSMVGSAVSINAPSFFEASYMHKHNGTYYYSYSTNFDNGAPTIDYMTSDNPLRGFTHRGTVLPNPPNNNNNNNHASIIEYKGQSYIFYHNRSVSGHSYRRSINVDTLSYNSDGTMRRSTPTTSGVAQIKNFDPFRKFEAETMDSQNGIETERASEGGMNVMFDNGDWIKLSKVDFGSGANFIEARVASSSSTTFDILLNSLNSTPVGTLQIPNTGGLQSWQSVTAELNGAVGIADVYFRARGRVNVNWYQFAGEPDRCGAVGDTPVCCYMSADPNRDGWGEQLGNACIVTEDTEGYAPLNPADVVAAINVGGSGDYFNDIYYQADLNYSGGEEHSTTDSIVDAGDSSLFTSERFGEFSYNIPVENGDYSVELHFVEMYWEENGGRSFNVDIESVRVISQLDIFQSVGHDVAYSREFEVNVSDGALNIELSTNTDNGTLSGILVKKVEGAASSSSQASSTPASSSASTSSVSSAPASSSSSAASSTGSNSPPRAGSTSPWLVLLLSCGLLAIRRFKKS